MTSRFNHLLFAIFAAIISSCEKATAPNILEPVHLASTPTNIVVTRVSSLLIRVEWQDTTSERTGFLLERSTDSVAFERITSLSGSILSVIDTIKSYGTYVFRVFTLTKDDTSDARISSPHLVSDPIPTQHVAGYFDQEYLQLSWSAEIPFATGFVVEKSVNSSPYEETSRLSSTADPRLTPRDLSGCIAIECLLSPD